MPDSTDQRNDKRLKFSVLSISIALGVVICGFVMELLNADSSILFPPWPANLFYAFLFWMIVIFIHFKQGAEKLKVFSGADSAILSIIVYLLLLGLKSIISADPANHNSFLYKTGLTDITRSWLYFLSVMYIFTVLAFSILRRSRPFNFNNISYILVHFGFWLALATNIFGSSDMVWLKMPVFKDHKTGFAFDQNNLAYQMPFELQLSDLLVDQYPPNLAVIKNIDHNLLVRKAGHFISASPGSKGVIENWKINVTEYFHFATRTSSGSFVPDTTSGSVPAAYIKVASTRNDTFLKEGWVSSGSSVNPRSILKLNATYSIIMTIPKPKGLASEVKIFEADSSPVCRKVMVNKPGRIRKWNIYQAGYDKNMGIWSDYSLLEVVYDPWHYVLLTGICIMIMGVILLLFRGSLKRKNSTE